MKKVFKVFINDLRNISKNWAAIIIFCGLCLLPSLYAWVNIKACWNPYANTGNLPVAVINNDEGTTLKGKTINVGNEVVKQLKKNKSINWNIVDAWQANYGLNEGKYYALIEIPNDFSSKLTSLTTSNPIKPNITYRANEKLNAIATKITNVAKNKLTDEIKTNFVSTVNKEAFNYLNKLGGELQINKPQIIQLKDCVDSAKKNLDDVKKHINDANSNAESLSKFLNDVQNNLPKITEQITSLQNTTEANKSLIFATRQSINNLANDFKNDAIRMQGINDQINSLIQSLKSINNSTISVGDQKQLISKIEQNINSLNSTLNNFVAALQALNKVKPSLVIQGFIDSAKNVQSLLKDESNKLSHIEDLINKNNLKDNKDNVNKLINAALDVNNQIYSRVNNTYNMLYSSLLPTINNISNNLAEGTDVANSILEASKSLVPQLTALNTFGSANTSLASNEAKKLITKLEDFQKQLEKLKDKTKDLNGNNLDKIVTLLKKNPNMVSNFISSPIEVKETEVYDAGIFGVALTPFYTVLGIWVGVLLASALLSVESEEYIDGEKINFLQRHFGKMLLFMFLSCIQTLIVTIGDKLVLGVHPQNMMLMIGIALLTSLTFTIMIFTLVSLLGNIGKAVAVVIMVFQIAGSAGIYPIQTNPKIFGILQPLWPFTYAINGFREAIAGPLWSDVMKNVSALLIFCVVFLLLGLLKKPLHKLNEFMEHQFKESGL